MSTYIPLALHQTDLTGGVRVPFVPPKGGEKFPEPVFPQKPDLLTDAALPGDGERHWTPSQIWHTFHGWAIPYFKSRVLPGDLHPIVAYLFTEYKCNLDCHYCYSYDNRVKGISEEVAKAAIDWLHDGTCRALALMGGEVMLRPKLVHKIIYYARKKGFFTYIPTNGRLLTPDWIDRIGDAGVSTFNLAVDAVDEKPGLPKALNPIRKQFEHLVKKQYRYGYTVFFNINICRNNLDDVKQLTEIAHEYKISTDYHINEMPLIEQPHFQRLGTRTEVQVEELPAKEHVDLVDVRDVVERIELADLDPRVGFFERLARRALKSRLAVFHEPRGHRPQAVARLDRAPAQ